MIKLIADSSADLFAPKAGACFESVPMTIHAGERSFTDDTALNVNEMLDYLAAYKGKSGTACPGPERWMRAFEGADEIFVVTITSALSGTYGSAMAARELYLQEHPCVKLHVFDSLTTGPEMRLLLEKLAELAAQGKSFEEIRSAGEAYLASTHLAFCLRSLHNLAQNGRISPLAAGAVGLLGIRVLAVASAGGTIEPVEKCRGDRRAQSAMIERMIATGYRGGKVRISHVEDPAAALRLELALHERFPQADVAFYPCLGLCSYYAERGGVLVGYETE